MRSKVSPLCQSGMLIASWAQHHRPSKCIEMLSVLRGLGHRALKANRLLYDPIIKLKVDCLGIQGCMDVGLVWLANLYKSYASGSVDPLSADQEFTWYLAGAKHLTRLGTRNLFFETYHFCCWADVDILYAAPQAHGIVNIALHREYSLGIVFIFSQGRKNLYHV
jgi:hypothetical protein